MIKIGMIGFGNMAMALTEGWLEKKVLEPAQLYASAVNQDKLKKNCERFGIHAASSADIAKTCDVVLLCAKPNKIAQSVEGIKEDLKDKLIISIAWGMSFDQIEEILPDTSHISIIPNTPVCVGQGIVIVQRKNSLDQDQLASFERLFEPVSLIVVVDENQLSIAGTIAGCAPAFTAMYLEALSDAGVAYGLPRSVAYDLAAKMIEGTGAMYLEKKAHPGIMKDAVCSPAGSTIKGVMALEERGFRGDVIAAVSAIEK